MRQYADMKTSLLSYERLQILRTDTNVLLTHRTPQALYTLLQQERIIQLAHQTAKSYRLKTALYRDASKQARQTIYFIRKRPREQWDPTLWEVPLQPPTKYLDAIVLRGGYRVKKSCRWSHYLRPLMPH